MQELRSTDILDKEIQADARRKVERILKTADAECERVLNSVQERVNQAVQEKETFYKNKLSVYESHINAAIPLEKQRFEVNFVQNTVADALNSYIESLDEEKRINLVLKNLSQDLIKDKKFTAYIYGFDIDKKNALVVKKLKDILGNGLLKCEKTEFGKIVDESNSDFEINRKEGVILEAEDKSLRLRLTLTEAISHILDEKRSELYQALFGLEKAD